MKKMFVILGADNVGKTTMMNNSMLFVQETLNLSTDFVHFSAPKVEDPYILYQYNQKLQTRLTESVVKRETDYIYLDRAWPESKFYELNRRGRHVSYEECFECERAYLDFAKRWGYEISINVMFKPWNFVEKFHRFELENNKEFVKQSAALNNESVDIEERRLEHEKYYRFMIDYRDTREQMVPDIANQMPWNTLHIRDLNFVLV